MRILDVGCGPNSVAAQMFEKVEDKEVVRLDIDPDNKPDVVHDISSPLPVELVGAFDVVIAYHVMEHLDRAVVIQSFKNITAAVRNGGELWVSCPSLEWACDEIKAHREGTYVQAVIFGNQHSPWDYHRCGFTMQALRQMVAISGMIVKKATQSTYFISSEEKQYRCIQNVVVGAKYENPGEAIGLEPV